MRRTKRFFAALLCLCMVMALLPTAAFAATERSMQLRTDGIGYGDTVYDVSITGGKTVAVGTNANNDGCGNYASNPSTISGGTCVAAERTQAIKRLCHKGKLRSAN